MFEIPTFAAPDTPETATAQIQPHTESRELQPEPEPARRVEDQPEAQVPAFAAPDLPETATVQIQNHTESHEPEPEPDSEPARRAEEQPEVRDPASLSVDNYRSRLGPDTPLADVLLAAGIGAEEQALAFFNSASLDLWQMFQNHRSAAAILGVLGLAADNRNNRIKYKGGLTLSTDQVVTHLGWHARTLERKTKAFSLARQEVAKWTWTGAVPTTEPAQKKERKQYRKWTGLVAMFRDGGFCDKPKAPHKSAPQESERQAARLSQNYVYHLANNLAQIQPNLGPRGEETRHN
ncbi:hypothetical protein FB451DRAFT_1407042 [Mycena latifolia]|nr:hypothetical protein FB451DRAFT_1407042 [Mycena latifolia]